MSEEEKRPVGDQDFDEGDHHEEYNTDSNAYSSEAVLIENEISIEHEVETPNNESHVEV